MPHTGRGMVVYLVPRRRPGRVWLVADEREELIDFAVAELGLRGSGLQDEHGGVRFELDSAGGAAAVDRGAVPLGGPQAQEALDRSARQRLLTHPGCAGTCTRHRGPGVRHAA